MRTARHNDWLQRVAANRELIIRFEQKIQTV
jgi:hypothetical protein